MSDMLTNGGESAPGTAAADHNVANVTKMIKDCAASMIKIRGERRGLNERAGDIRKRIRDSGQAPAALDFAIRILEMDDAGREGYLESLRLSFDALGIGAQADMFPAAGAEPASGSSAGPSLG